MDLSVNKVIKTPKVKEVLINPFIDTFKEEGGYLTVIGECKTENTVSYIVEKLSLDYEIPLSSIFYVENEIDSIMLMQIVDTPDIHEKKLIVIDDANSRPSVGLLCKLLTKGVSVIVRVEPRRNLVEQFLDSTGFFCRKSDPRTLYSLIPYLFSIISDLGEVLLELALGKRGDTTEKGSLVSCIENYQITFEQEGVTI